MAFLSGESRERQSDAKATDHLLHAPMLHIATNWLPAWLSGARVKTEDLSSDWRWHDAGHVVDRLPHTALASAILEIRMNMLL